MNFTVPGNSPASRDEYHSTRCDPLTAPEPFLLDIAIGDVDGRSLRLQLQPGAQQG
jgi:hypothetical protein